VTPAQKELIRANWRQVSRSDQAAALFCKRLFEPAGRHPALRRTEMVRQGRMLMQTLGIVVASLDSIGSCRPSSPGRGIGYGVQPAHYATVGAAFLWTLEQGLGDATADDRAAWARPTASSPGHDRSR
jgi:hypothetical protein